MAYLFADRVKDTTTTTGTGTITITGTAPAGFNTFATAFAVNDTFPLLIRDSATGAWETSYATLASSTTIARTVFKNSSTGSAINFAAGIKDVWCDMAAFSQNRDWVSAVARLTPLDGSDFHNNSTVWGPFSYAGITGGSFAPSAIGIPTANHPGCLTFSSGTTLGSGVQINTNVGSILLGGGEQFDCVFKTPAAFTSITTRIGFHDCATSADAVDGCYFEIPATGVAVCKTSNNSVRTTSATIATLAVNTWYHARVKVNANATGVDFTIFDDSGTQLGTVNITTNIPTVSGRECGAGFIVTNAGAVATLSGIIDYMALGQQGRTLVRGAAS